MWRRIDAFTRIRWDGDNPWSVCGVSGSQAVPLGRASSCADSLQTIGLTSRYTPYPSSVDKKVCVFVRKKGAGYGWYRPAASYGDENEQEPTTGEGEGRAQTTTSRTAGREPSTSPATTAPRPLPGKSATATGRCRCRAPLRGLRARRGRGGRGCDNDRRVDSVLIVVMIGLLALSLRTIQAPIWNRASILPYRSRYYQQDREQRAARPAA